MLILILIVFQYSQNAVFSFEEDLYHQNRSYVSHQPVKKFLPAVFTASLLFTFYMKKNSDYIETLVVKICKYIVIQITRPVYWTTYCIILFFSMEYFGKLRVGCWISDPRIPCSKPLGSSKVDSAFHFSEVDIIGTRIFWELSGIK